jgi:methionyl-tRNA formyltransferase
MKILFMGRKAIAARCLAYLREQRWAEIVGVLTDSHLTGSITAAAAREFGLPLYTFEQATTAMLDGILKYDFGVSVLYWRKLKGPFLSVPPLGTLNFHPAPLPDYKGTAGYNLAILENLSQWGVSCHYVDAEIDTGGIVEVSRFPIDREHATVRDLEEQSAHAMEVQFRRVIGRIRQERGLLPTIRNEGGRYISRSEMELMKEIRPGDDVARKVRAFWYPPYDGAYTVIDGVKYTLVDRGILMKLGDPAVTNLHTAPQEATPDPGSELNRL